MCDKDYCTLFPDNPKKYLLFGKRISICKSCKKHDKAWEKAGFINKLKSDWELMVDVTNDGSWFIGLLMYLGVSTFGIIHWLGIKRK